MGIRTLNDPGTMLAVSAGSQVLGGVMSGVQARDRGNTEASFLRTQAEQEKVGLSRDREALGLERDRTLARARALFAAGGGDTTSGSAAANLEYSHSVFGGQDLKLVHDSEARQRSLYARAIAAQEAGQNAMTASIFGGLGKAAGALAGSNLDLFGSKKMDPRLQSGSDNSGFSAVELGGGNTQRNVYKGRGFSWL